MRRFYVTCMLTLAAWQLNGQSCLLSLDSCRALALRNNKELRMAELKEQAAHYEQQAAFTNFLPKVSGMGGYLRMEKEVSIASDEQKKLLGSLGTMGQGVAEALRTDTRNTSAMALMLEQPLYMGGKITAYHRVSRLAGRVAQEEYELQRQDLLTEVDETYWSIVLLHSKRLLAESYLELVRTLDDHVQKMIAQGMATKADGLSVRVKVNEAEVTLIRVDNGLSVSKMLLCQLCGLPIDADVTLEDEGADELPPTRLAQTDVAQAWSSRPELRALRLSAEISKEKVKVTRAEYLPTLALTGGYLWTNPSVFNGFQEKTRGLWSVGVVLKMPLLTWGERLYKVKAAQAQVKMADYRWQEAREKVELQVNQNARKLREAVERYEEAIKSQEEADENLRYANLGMREGVIPVSNVLEAQTAWLSARSTRVEAQIDVKLADLYLRKSLGIVR